LILGARDQEEEIKDNEAADEDYNGEAAKD
jgi:Condensin complex subunit 2